MEHHLECTDEFIQLMTPLVPVNNICIRFKGTARRRAERQFTRSICNVAKKCKAHRQVGTVILEVAFENGDIEQYGSRMVLRVSEITETQVVRRLIIIVSMATILCVLVKLVIFPRRNTHQKFDLYDIH